MFGSVLISVAVDSSSSAPNQADCDDARGNVPATSSWLAFYENLVKNSTNNSLNRGSAGGGVVGGTSIGSATARSATTSAASHIAGEPHFLRARVSFFLPHSIIQLFFSFSKKEKKSSKK